MPSAIFLLSKDPVADAGGDVELSRLLMTLAAEFGDVSVICLSGEPAGTVGVDMGGHRMALTRVPKSAVRPLALLAGVARTRRSLAHVRFDSPELVAAIDAAAGDVFVAEHSYMAESFLRSKRFGEARFVVNTHVSESLVWLATRGLLGRMQRGRLLADELRVAQAADAVGTFDAEEAQFYRAHGVPAARWMDLTLPPARQSDIAATPARLVLMGTRDWAPNQEAFLNALRLWPRIAADIPGAELCVIGAKKFGAPDPELPAGVRDLGFVDDLQAFLSSCRAMVAPIDTGGGVRVKILDAARMGLPVVGTHAAVGSLDTLLGLGSFDSDAAFVEQCRRYLQDATVAAADGDRIYQINRGYWQDRHPHRAAADLVWGVLQS